MKRSLILSLSAIALCALVLVPVLAGEDRAPTAAAPAVVQTAAPTTPEELYQGYLLLAEEANRTYHADVQIQPLADFDPADMPTLAEMRETVDDLARIQAGLTGYVWDEETAAAAARDLHRAVSIEVPIDGKTFVFRAEATFVIRAREADGLVCIREVRDPTVTPIKVPRGYTVTPVPGERSFGFLDGTRYQMTETFCITRGQATLYTAPSAWFNFDRTNREIHPVSQGDLWGQS